MFAQSLGERAGTVPLGEDGQDGGLSGQQVVLGAHVVAGMPADEDVEAAVADEPVEPGAADEDVVGLAAQEHVVAGPAQDDGPAAAGVEVVVAGPAVEEGRSVDVAGDGSLVVAGTEEHADLVDGLGERALLAGQEVGVDRERAVALG